MHALVIVCIGWDRKCGCIVVCVGGGGVGGGGSSENEHATQAKGLNIYFSKYGKLDTPCLQIAKQVFYF